MNIAAKLNFGVVQIEMEGYLARGISTQKKEVQKEIDIEYEYWCAESFSKKQAMNAFNAVTRSLTESAVAL